MRSYHFLIFLLFCISCNQQIKPPANAEKGPISYLALGDSYTIGESVAPGQRWPVQLVNALNQNGHITANPTIIATTGWTTDELSSALDRAELNGTYDMVSLLIGVNNQYRGRDVENFRTEYKALLERAIGYAGGNKDRVFVVSIPDWGAMPFGQKRDPEKVGEEIDIYNRVKQEVTEEMDVVFIDITPISREAVNDLELVAGDDLHPSGKMYSRWVKEAILEVVIRGIENNGKR